MAIKTGIGVGEAQVYDTSGIINTYFKLAQKQQQEEAKYQNELADLISKVDTNGINDADKIEIANMYGSIKDLYSQAATVRSPQEKALLRSKVSKAVLDLNEYAENSKNFIKRYSDLANDMAKNQWAYDQNKIEEFKKLKDMPLSKLGSKALLDPFEYQRMPDSKSRDNTFGTINKKGEAFAQFGFVPASGGREQYVGVLDDNKIAELVSYSIDANPEYKSLAYSNWAAANPNQPLDKNKVIANEVALYKTQYGNTYKSAPVRKPTSGGSKAEQKEAASISERNEIISRLNNLDSSAADDLLNMLDLPYGSTSKIVSGKSISPAGRGRTVNSLRVTIPKSEYQSIVDAGIDIPFTMSPDKKQMTLDFEIGSKDFNRGLNVFMNKFSSGTNVKNKEIKPSAPKAKTSGNITVVLPNGKEGEIPASNWEAFRKKYPGAKRK